MFDIKNLFLGGSLFPSFDNFDTDTNSYIGQPPRKQGEEPPLKHQGSIMNTNDLPNHTDGLSTNEELDYYEDNPSVYGDLPLYEKDISSFDADADDYYDDSPQYENQG